MKGDKATCAICGAVVFEKGFYRHTAHAHDMNKEEYTRLHGEPEVFRDEESEMVLNNTKEESTPIVVEIIKNIEKPVTTYSDVEVVCTKNEVFSFLKTLFPNIQTDQFIIKRLSDASLVYRLITDFVDYENMVNFEFTDMFWHNYDVAYNNVRDMYLTRDGWKVYRFSGTSFKKSDIKKAME